MRDRNFGVYNMAQQKMIAKAKICVVGLGCVGELAAVMLARIGIRRLVVTDHDFLELTNLNRNAYSTRSMIGKRKVENILGVLKAVDPSISIRQHAERFSFENGERIIRGCDVILQAVDDMASRVIIHRIARRADTPCVTMTGAPRFRFGVTTIMPASEDFETFFSLPTASVPDEEFEKPETRAMIADLSVARASAARRRGAVPEWAELYSSGKRRTWAVTPERVYISAVLCVRECIKIILGERPIMPPQLIVGDLDAPKFLVRVERVDRRHRWRYDDF